VGTKTALRTWVLGAAVAVASILAPVGTGRAADDPEAAEAKKHYEEGTKAFNLGEYPRAISEFKATYNAKPDPLLLYNIAQSYRLQGDPSQALFFYKSFLRNMPNAPNRKEVEGRIKTLEKQIAEQKTDQKEPAAIAPIRVTR
jgi:outer membrane protein assembly factor BamD (BamD/ComL family)